MQLLGSSSLFLTIPFVSGCVVPEQQKTATVSMVKNLDHAYAIRKAIELAGGLDFISPGDSVLLKLALNSPSPFPATTSPTVVSELVTLLKEYGAGDVFVGDKSPVWVDTMDCLEDTGIYQASIDAGAEITVFEDTDMVSVKPADALYWPDGFSIPSIFNKIDHIIVLPTLRTHSLADFTMGIKIFVGAIPQEDRHTMHRSPHFLKAIAEIALCTDKTRLSLLDARQGFNQGGPDTGNLITPGIIIASQDIVAADAVGIAPLKTTDTTARLQSIPVWNHPTIKRAVQAYSPNLSSETLALITNGIDNADEINKQLS